MSASSKNKKRRSTCGLREKTIDYDVSTNKTHYMSQVDRIRYRKPLNETTLGSTSLEILLQKTWKIYKMTLLNNYSLDKRKLKSCSIKIKQALVKDITEDKRNVSFKVEVDTLPNIEEYSYAIQIAVHLQVDSSPANIKYKGYIFANANDSTDNIENLPLLLCTGTVKVIQIVHEALKKYFDCVVHSVFLSKEDLMWIGAILCDFITEPRGNEIKFTYFIPNMATQNFIEVVLDCDKIQELWKNIHSEDSDEISYEEVYMLYKKLSSQLIIAFGIKFEHLKLHKITLPEIVLTSDGKIRIQSLESANQIIRFINDASNILISPYQPMSFKLDN